MESSFGMELEYELDDDCEFTLNGSDSTYRAIRNALDDSDIIVTLEFDDDNIVTSVTAQAKTVKGILKGADDKRIIIVDDDGGRMSFGLDRNMECEFDGDEVTYSKFKSLYKDAESAVVAEVEIDDDGNVISVAAQSSSDSEGTVVSISSSSVVFEDIAGIEHEYKIEPAMVGYLNGEKLGSVAKVLEYAKADGATIKVTFSSRGYVNRIYVTLDD
ncbi:MAG: hypothetical protein LUE88_07100 [Clostridiales bacterium]|nr:hypothetical protein [Clostridiales bacterium]